MTIEEMESPEARVRLRWRSEQRGSARLSAASALKDGVQKSPGTRQDKAREKRMKEARDPAVPDLSEAEPFPGASMPLY